MFFIIDESILEGVGIGEELGDLFIIIELPPVCYVFGYWKPEKQVNREPIIKWMGQISKLR